MQVFAACSSNRTNIIYAGFAFVMLDAKPSRSYLRHGPKHILKSILIMDVDIQTFHGYTYADSFIQ